MFYITLWLWALAATPFLLFLSQILYNVFLHPLRKFPGPRIAGATSLWRAYKEVILKETLAQELFDLHRKHGRLSFQAIFNFDPG